MLVAIRSDGWPTTERRRAAQTLGETVEAFEKLKSLIATAEIDLAKAEGGNKQAGVRVRGVMQEIKEAAQNVRNAILELRGPAAEPPAKS